MTDTSRIDRLEVTIGGLSRVDLRTALRTRSILLNAYAEILLDSHLFDDHDARVIAVIERTVADLGHARGASLTDILEAGQSQGLLLCPADTGPYLRLAMNDQTASTDTAMSAGKAPEGSLTVASEPLSDDNDHPKGFYLRVVEGQAWLRGYRCDDEHIWSPDDRFLFQARSQ